MPTTAEVTDLLPVPHADKDDAGEAGLVVFARNPAEMAAAQQALTTWVTSKIARERQDAEELKANYALAVERKWKHSTVKRHWQRAVARVAFWEKVRDAFAAGYCLVPDLPVDVFAVRTSRTKPSAWPTVGESPPDGGWARARAPNEEAPSCGAAGEGRYVAPAPLESVRNGHYDTQKGVVVTQTRVPVAFADVDFPFVLARTQVLDATAQAMALKVFDDFGVLPESAHRNPAAAVQPDPLVIGRVLLPRCYGGRERRLCFVVAWFVDVRDLNAIK